MPISPEIALTNFLSDLEGSPTTLSEIDGRMETIPKPHEIADFGAMIKISGVFNRDDIKAALLKFARSAL